MGERLSTWIFWIILGVPYLTFLIVESWPYLSPFSSWPLFDYYPAIASFLLASLGLAEALMPEALINLPKGVRACLWIGLVFIGGVGVVSSLIQTERDRQEIIGELTGGDTYCYFMVDFSRGHGSPVTYPVTVSVKGEHPMRNVNTSIQTVSADPIEQLRNMRPLRLGNKELPPGIHLVPDRIGTGRHIITTWSRTRYINQVLEIVESPGQVTQFGDVYSNGKKLETINVTFKIP